MSLGSRGLLRVISSVAVLSAGALTPVVAGGGAAAVAATPAASRLCAPPADTVAPQITSVTFSTHSVDLSSGSRRVRVTAHAVDTSGGGAASGVREVSADLTGRRGFAQAHLSLASGTAADGIWTGTLRIPRNGRAGTWNLRTVFVSDRDRNTQFYDREGGSPDSPTDIRLQPNFDQSITVTGSGPTPPPTAKPGKLSGFTMSPTSVNTTHATKQVRVGADFTGPRPKQVDMFMFGGNGGVRFAQARRNARAAMGSTDAGLAFFQHVRLKRTTRNHWSGHLTIGRWLGNGKAQPELNVTYGSKVKPNFKQYDADALTARHFPNVVHITSGVDRDKPTLRTLSITPSPVDTTSGAQEVTMTATAHDATSGVGRIQAELFSRRGAGERAAFVTVNLKRAGHHWVGHAIIQQCVPSGSWDVRVFVGDKAGNFAGYAVKKLIAAGLPGHLTVFSTAGDSIEPTVTNSTASAAHHMITLDFSEGVKNVTGSTLTVFARQPAATRFSSPLTVSGITCFNGTGAVSCTGSGGLATSAELDVPGIAAGQDYEVFANLNSVTSQLTDGTGNPIDWSFPAAEVTGS
jgi:hypothetical protein